MSIRLVALQGSATQRAVTVRLMALALVLAAVVLILLQAKIGAGAPVALNPQPDLPG